MKRLAFVGLVAFTTACGSPAASLPAAAPSKTPTAEVSCGDVVLGQGELLEVEGSAQRTCLEAAFRDGRGAALTVTAPTVEGDPIVTIWNLAADGTLVADFDSSRDRFGADPRLAKVSCGRVTALPNPLRCTASG